MKCPEHPNTELEKLPTNNRFHLGQHRYLCPVDNHEWVIYKSLLPRRKKNA